MKSIKPKVLVITEVFFPEDFLINNLVTEWSTIGYDLEVLARVPSYPFGKVYKEFKNKIYSKNNYNGVTIHRVAFVQGYKKSVFLKILNYILYVILATGFVILKGRKFDRYFIYQTGPLSLAIPGIIAKKLFRRKAIIWTQDLWPDTIYAYGFKHNRLNDWILKGFVKFIYKNCETIFVTCTGFIKKIENYVPGHFVYYAPNWPITGVNSTTENIINMGNGFQFTFTGNIGKVQNLENVIRGFALFNKKYESANLNLVGEGSFVEDLKKMVADLNIPNVIFWGKHPVGMMKSFYAASHVLLFSLKDDPIFEITIPLKFQTYLTSGKPIFGIINGDSKKLIEDNKLGFTSHPSDINSIADGFMRFISISDFHLAQMSLNSKRLLESEFNREIIINRITNKVFEEC